MSAIKQARKFIQRKPQNRDAKTLARLVLGLETQARFPIADLYLLDTGRLQLALQILKEWRQDRRYASKVRLFDLCLQIAAPGKAAG